MVTDCVSSTKTTEAEGIYVNRAENGFVYPNVLKEIKEGTHLQK